MGQAEDILTGCLIVLAILEVRAARGWTLKQMADAFPWDFPPRLTKLDSDAQKLPFIIGI